jgi:hypothetical protein
MSATENPAARSPVIGPPETEFEPEWWSQRFWQRQQWIRERVLYCLTIAGRPLTGSELIMHIKANGSGREVRHALDRMAYNGLVVMTHQAVPAQLTWRYPRGKRAVYSLPVGKGAAVADHLEPFTLLKTKPGVCPECAVDHAADQPHDRMSLTYRYTFYRQHGRWPNWKDALAHCDQVVREQWERVLREAGQWEEDDAHTPSATEGGGHA